MSDKPRALTGLLNWERVDEVIERIKTTGPWYIHSPMEGMNSLFMAEGGDASQFLAKLATELKTRPHGPGWVYVHNPESPSWIKIYDPSKCGSSCSVTTPPAWWEMELNDPRSNQPVEHRRKKRFFSFLRGQTGSDAQV
jgi:hypothetical protein